MGKSKVYYYTRWKTLRRGRMDGRGYRWAVWPIKEKVSAYPLPDQTEPAAYEEEMNRLCEENISRLSEEWKAYDIKAKPVYCQAMRTYEGAQQNWEEECKDVPPAQEAYDKAKARYDMLPSPSLGAHWEWIVTSVAFAVEGPGLAFAYQLFGAGKTETYLMALLAMLVVPCSAIIFGHKLKKRNKNKMNWAFIWTILALMLGVLIGFAALRAGLFEHAMLSAAMPVTLSSGMVSAVFLAVNALSFVVCTAVSYKAGHEDPDAYRKAKLALKEAQLWLEREDHGSSEARKERDAAHGRLVQAREVRRKRFEELQAEANNKIEAWQYYCQLYRRGNINARKDKHTPPCFKQAIKTAALPPELRNEALDWDCPSMNPGQLAPTTNTP